MRAQASKERMGFLVFDAVDLQRLAIFAGRLKVTGAALRFRSRERSPFARVRLELQANG
jgi:hypothetical protein